MSNNLQLADRLAALTIATILIAGCGGTGQKKDTNFFTSGSHEADQRADQTMVKSEQLNGGANGGAQTAAGSEGKLAYAADKSSLYDQLGGDEGIKLVVDDFTPRLLADPRVNFAREGVTRGGFSFHHWTSVTWNATPENVAMLKKQLIQFIALATGGPSIYEGKEMQAAHAGLHIANPEFDAAVGDLKASLDKLKVPNKLQKDLLSIIESTRPEIVEER
jgi:hemoglobin